ncbi:PE-PGRS family protein [Streptomyces sp. NPDC004134]|uniref:PE-PGRS family protein n=1 Tax=Streptomyces sp. NPDC004134 TaxID=3364691 RepID=UPI0036811B5E
MADDEVAGLLAGGPPRDRRGAAAEAGAWLTRRLRRGPLFTGATLEHIERLSAEDPAWLEALGIGSVPEAEEYLRAGRYHDWLRLPPGKRLLLASLEWRSGGTHTAAPGGEAPTHPAYTLGRFLTLRDEELPAPERARLTAERNDQIHTTFVRTLEPSLAPRPPAALARVEARHRHRDLRSRTILRRVFLVLQCGLQVYRNGVPGGHRPLLDTDVARALAHGGRINIRIPQRDRAPAPHALLDWLGLTEDGTDTDPAERRRAGTHHMRIGRNEAGAGSGTFEELGGHGASARNTVRKLFGPRRVRLYGVDLSAGGLGTVDFNGDVVVPDGSHGHMFLGFTPPGRHHDGALQIGVETIAPGAPSPVGYRHDWRSTEATANPESRFFGFKQDKIGDGGMPLSSRYVDLAALRTADGGDWPAYLAAAERRLTELVDAADADPARLAALYAQLTGPRTPFFQPPG